MQLNGVEVRMTTRASSEEPNTPTMEPSTPATRRRGFGFLMVLAGLVLIVIGGIGLTFFFMVPALGLIVAGGILCVAGSREFSRGEPRRAIGPGRAA
jgi:hypothetical protein